MKLATTTIEGAFVYSCSFEEERGLEPFVPENLLAYQISGETHVFHQGGTTILKKNQLLLARKNQLANSLKIPAMDQEYKVMALILSKERLQHYALTNNMNCDGKYEGDGMLLLNADSYFTTYFSSLLPYLEQSRPLNDKLARIKISEAIELILQRDERLKNILFDFSEPQKIDLEEFMKNNFHYNTSLETFAKLTGRSLAGFKRDFTKTFNMPPGKWLMEKRLAEAYHLIKKKKHNPTDIYLDVGFENLTHFYRVFKQKFGATPKEIMGVK
ncbi:helix-turn-helix domain-containing protein [Chryseolinea soli]|uniref:AraC family transcriptional regulator n=1 Tax=Chryseolinea soli TaxID=2321403 RepID=A0A385T160_9BACT|nr:AraC family transcriptional regulator [Chryseolinea soli]AYB34828.1 AraC family transcriptional regulator [Chryseolinea soli]